MDYIKNRFKIDTETLGKKCFFILGLDENEKLVNDEIQMLSANTEEAFLQFDLRQRDEMLSLCYDVTSKLRLSGIIEKEMKSKNFIKIALSIIEAIRKCDDYLINSSNLVLMEDYIYVDITSHKASLMYVPVEKSLSGNVDEEFKDFLKRLIDTKLVLDDDKLFAELTRKLRDQSVRMGDIEEYLKNYKGTNVEIVEKRRVAAKQAPAEAVKPVQVIKPKTVEEVTPKKKPEKTAEKINKKSDEKSKNKSVEKGKKSKKGMAILIRLVLTFLATGVVVSTNLDNATKMKASGVVVAVGLALTLTTWFKKDKSVEIQEASKGKAKKEKKEKKKNNKKNDKKNEVKQEVENVEFLQSAARAGRVSNDTEFLGADDGATVMLGVQESNQKRFILKSKVDERDIIKITKGKFTLGRLDAYADGVLSSNAVSKIHAEIIERNGEHLLKDLNAKNGTFINGERIKNETEYALNENDVIKFANVEYVFTCIE